MNYKKILLITPPVQTELGPVRPSIGLGYLSQVLVDSKIEHCVFDMLLGYSVGELLQKIAEFKPDLLGISLFSNKYKTAYAALAEVRRAFPELCIVAGGPHVSCLREELLADCPEIDYGVYLEGEAALLDLCNGMDPEKIGNLIFRKSGKIVVNPPRAFISDLDVLGFPKYERFDIEKYISERAIISSRGCPHSCTYCAVKVVMGRQVRLRSPKSVADELEYWYKKGYRQFSFQDDNFILTENRAAGIFDEITARGMRDLLLRCAGARADMLSRNILERMQRVGFKTIAIGAEVGNNRMLEVVKKGERFEDIEFAVKTACELGFDVYLNFLAGVPFETLADIEDSVNFALKYPVFYAEWSNIIPYPGTEMYEWLKGKGYLLKQPEEYLNTCFTTSTEPVFETPELPYAVRKKLLVFLKKVRVRVLRRGMRLRLERQGIPKVVSHILSYIISSDAINKYLFQNKVRRMADFIRFRLYMRKSKVSGNKT